jgi:hypothetical protein
MQIRRERLIRRHQPYFRGWAQAFGAHEPAARDGGGLRWLLGDEQLGLILTPDIRHAVQALVDDAGEPETAASADTGSQGTPLPAGEHALDLGSVTLPIVEAQRAVAAFAAKLLAAEDRDLHIYQTYHLIYPSGTRILTLSRRAPLPLIYREIEPLSISLIRCDPPELRSAAGAC